MTRRIIGLFVCALVAITVPGRSEAQGIKGMIKKKVTAPAKGEQKAAEDPRTAEFAKGIKGGKGLDVTGEVVEDFITGLTEELRLRKEFKKQLAAYKTPDEWRACSGRVASSPEMQKIMMSLADVPEGTTTEQMQRITQKMQADMQALVKGKCGGNIDEDWPTYKRRERLGQIQTAGAAAFEAARSTRSTRTPGPSVYESALEYPVVSSEFYAWLKDITAAFCKSKKEGLIELNEKGFYDFSFSSSVPFSHFMTQDQAGALYSACVWIETHDPDLDLMDIQR